jgi:integrase
MCVPVSANRIAAWHSRGQEFNSPHLHLAARWKTQRAGSFTARPCRYLFWRSVCQVRGSTVPTQPRVLVFRGQSLTLAQAAKKTGIPAETIRSRIDHQGMTVEDALTRPVASKFNPRKKPVAMPKPCPEPRRHSSGQACVRWSAGRGRRVRYLGVWGSREAAQAYTRFQAEWVGGLLLLPDVGARGLLVGELAVRYLAHVGQYYRKDGKATSEVAGHKAAMKFLAPFARQPVTEVRAALLRSCQAAMVKAGLGRTTVNQYSWRITRCFRWGVGEDLVAPDVAAVLESVPNLQPGRTTAGERPPIMSVPADRIEAVIPHLHTDPQRRAVLEAMIRFMLFTGMRPGELCAMTGASIDRSGKCWCYHAPDKNLHRQARRKPRLIWIGPQAQAVLAPYLAAAGVGRVWVFPPKGKGTRRTAVSRANFGEHVRLACERAGVDPWHPHQLRHNRATEVLRIYESDEAAAAAIGDTPDVARLVYADPNEAAARRIALATG